VSVFGIDHAWGRPGVAALKRAGVKFVCRYLSHSSDEKNLTRGEAKQLSDAGIWLVVVWETTASRALSGRAGGIADAKTAKAQAKACGMPDDRPIYFAVDWDASPQQQAAIHAYLDGAASVIGRGRVGMYAGYGPIKRAFDAGKIRYGWQTYAWSGGRWDKRAHLQQYSNERVINGVDVDYNRAVTDDYGQWRIGSTPEEDELTPEDRKKLAAEIADALVHKGFNARGRTVGLALQTADDGIPKLLAGMARLLQNSSHDVDEAALAAQLASMLTPALAADLLSHLTPESIAEALPEAVAERFVDALTARLARPTADGEG
jgi:hypothetical protein